ncbi:LOW QUALITY PROTEIN: sortilin-related receptor-like [Liolophura sinensis]|uniref:LOW QUALITY PROTEIN: sortilin-related receptor-like n=1 Tax=Liolophura sinensis TaxID=3198878 RepID=UPI0031590871
MWNLCYYQSKQCSLHLSQEFSKLYPGSKTVPILSKKSAPGLILASGTMGKNLKRRPNVYLSRDAGLRWREIQKGNYFYAFGDFGGVIVAVSQFSLTNEILYSKDIGETWHTYQFAPHKIRVYGLLTEPGEKTTVFSIFGSHTGAHNWLILQVNVSSIFATKCNPDDDYKEWSLSDDQHFSGCLLGRKTVF